MINLEKYLTDGMPWQEQMVLAYVRGAYDYAVDESYNRDSKSHDAEVLVTTYENGREKGYVFALRYLDRQKNYAVYTHCIGDCICLMMSEAFTDAPNGWEGREWKKHEHDMEFAYEEPFACGKWIVDDIRRTIERWKTDKTREDYEVRKQGMLAILRDACKTKPNNEIVFGENNPKHIIASYCGETRKERVDYFYLNSEENVCIVTYAVEDGEARRYEDVCSEFDNYEIEQMLKICDLL